ncbi:MAG: DNA alkylation repair protein [Crenarchaeota archaeon 13_1_40CM_2_52_14]|nr:MAG: DNA alkylation repair protein [Crenarchaeota archaeon 13_1_40CM_3_52_17]OLD34478.1 MAG: DNA alkylation repair protein [Crenarchaeota archaeon 13_1_40CM_2_52_14]OLE68262.1 MAG: DNA alkylation repair protein [archaeon 13_1_20CM_2_51_12]
MEVQQVIDRLKLIGDPKAVEGMARFGIQSSNSFGVSVPKLRTLAREFGSDHLLASKLWETGLHDARLLATMIDDPRQVTLAQMEKWVRDFDSWDVVDGCCGNLFDKTPFAVAKAKEWCRREAEYEKRAGFVLMAELAVHDKSAKDPVFRDFLALMIDGAKDKRNFVKKAVNWSLRQIGKRNLKLNRAAISTALKMQKMESGSAKWVASDALRELKGSQVQKRLRERK